jgi:predicted nucleic acid-binding protein
LIVAFDTSVLVYLFDDQANAPIDAGTGAPVSDCKDRLDFLIATLQRDKARIVIPTPAPGELLVRAREAGPEWLAILNKSRHFRIAGFDERAAVEVAATQAERIASGRKNEGATRAKAKFDDQIVAIAAVEGATVIYSDDPHIEKIVRSRFAVIGVADLPLTPRDAQSHLPFDQQDEPTISSDDPGEQPSGA